MASFPKVTSPTFSKIFFFNVCELVCYIYVGGLQRHRKMVSDSLKLELKAVVSHDVLGTKSKSPHEQ